MIYQVDHDVQHLDEDDAAPELPVGDGQACELVEARHLLAGAAFSYLGVTILREDRNKVYGTTKPQMKSNFEHFTRIAFTSPTDSK